MRLDGRQQPGRDGGRQVRPGQPSGGSTARQGSGGSSTAAALNVQGPACDRCNSSGLNATMLAARSATGCSRPARPAAASCRLAPTASGWTRGAPQTVMSAAQRRRTPPCHARLADGARTHVYDGPQSGESAGKSAECIQLLGGGLPQLGRQERSGGGSGGARLAQSAPPLRLINVHPCCRLQTYGSSGATTTSSRRQSRRGVGY